MENITKTKILIKLLKYGKCYKDGNLKLLEYGKCYKDRNIAKMREMLEKRKSY